MKTTVKTFFLSIYFLFGTFFSSYGQSYINKNNIELYKNSMAYNSYIQAWENMLYDRPYSVLNFVNASLRSKVTIQALALKTKALYLFDSNHATYQALLTYREAEKLDKELVFLPPYDCVVRGTNCGNFYEWEKLEQIRKIGYKNLK